MSNSPEITDQPAFVAFCDILGFSARVRAHFDETTALYETFTRLLLQVTSEETHTSIFSDAIIITSSNLMRLVEAVNVLWFAAQTHFFILRGGIASGRVWRKLNGSNVIVVSDALIRAVEIEKTVKHPAVAFDECVDLTLPFWIPRFSDGPHLAPVLHYGGLNIVNPFGRYWFASALPRFEQMKDSAGTDHGAKYDWLIKLHRSVSADDDLVPPAVVAFLLEKGVIKRRQPPK